MSRISAIFLPASRLLLASPERAGQSRRAGHGAVVGSARHWRYAHVTALPADAVNAPLLGVERW